MRDTDLTDATWRTSSYSGGNGNCVEVTDNCISLASQRGPGAP